MKYYNFFLVCFLVFSCNNKKGTISPSEVISIDCYSENNEKYVNSKEYFDDCEIIPLETTDKSLFRTINRIVLYQENIFILDIRSKSVLIFDKKGKFISNIRNIGKGPGEYIQLTDFSIDEANNNIVLYSDIPYKLLFFDLKGNYIKETKLDDFYNCFSINESNYVFFNNYPHMEKEAYLNFIDKKNGKSIEYLPIKYNSENVIFNEDPNLITSTDLYFFNAFEFDVYKISANKISPAYHINTGAKQIPLNTLKKLPTAIDVMKFCNKNKLYHSIRGFRETKDFIIFGLVPSGELVLYSKKYKTTKKFNVVKDEEKGLMISNYLAHDGNDNNVIFYTQAQQFKMNFRERSNSFIQSHPEYLRIKQLADKVSNDDNPLLFIYHLKTKL